MRLNMTPPYFLEQSTDRLRVIRCSPALKPTDQSGRTLLVFSIAGAIMVSGLSLFSSVALKFPFQKTFNSTSLAGCFAFVLREKGVAS